MSKDIKKYPSKREYSSGKILGIICFVIVIVVTILKIYANYKTEKMIEEFEQEEQIINKTEGEIKNMVKLLKSVKYSAMNNPNELGYIEDAIYDDFKKQVLIKLKFKLAKEDFTEGYFEKEETKKEMQRGMNEKMRKSFQEVKKQIEKEMNEKGVNEKIVEKIKNRLKNFSWLYEIYDKDDVFLISIKINFE